MCFNKGDAKCSKALDENCTQSQGRHLQIAWVRKALTQDVVDELLEPTSRGDGQLDKHAVSKATLQKLPENGWST